MQESPIAAPANELTLIKWMVTINLFLTVVAAWKVFT
jgi:hypothetical protein